MIALLIAFLLGVAVPFVGAVVFWKKKGLKFVCVEDKQQAVEIVIWPGEWAIGCARQYRDYTV